MTSHGNFSSSAEFVKDVVAIAIKHKKQIKIWYVTKEGNSEARMVEPLELPNEKMFTAWCTLRSNYRHFSFDRVARAMLTDYNRTYIEPAPKELEVTIGDQTVKINRG